MSSLGPLRLLLGLGWGCSGGNGKGDPDSHGDDSAGDSAVAVGEVSVDVELLGAGAYVANVTAEPAQALSITCDGADDHLTLTSPATTSTAFDLVGTLAETAYHCVLTGADGASATADFETGVAPPMVYLPTGDVPTDKVLLLDSFPLNHDPESMHFIVILDSQGRVRWSEGVPDTGPDLAIEWLGDGQLLFGGGGRPPVLEGLDHHVSFDARSVKALDGWYTHDVRWLPTGEILAIAGADDTDGDRVWAGFEVRVIDPVTQQITWTWSSQAAFDAGVLIPGPVDGSVIDDPYHVNSVSYLDDDGEPSILLNFRNTNLAWLIRLDTGDVVWKIGFGGDFALYDEAGLPLDQFEWWHTAHAPEFDGAHFKIFDNGTAEDAEVRAYDVDSTTMSATLTWVWTYKGWHNTAWGDVDTLPSGHVLVTENTRIEEIDPSTDAELWDLRSESGAYGTYRSELLDLCDVLPGRCS